MFTKATAYVKANRNAVISAAFFFAVVVSIFVIAVATSHDPGYNRLNTLQSNIVDSN